MRRPGTPRAAAHDRVALLTAFLVAAAVAAPLPDVAEHVVQAERIRQQFRHRLPAAPLRLVLWVGRVGDVEPGVFRLLPVRFAEVASGGGAGAGGPLPLRLGWQV